ncbi:MAG: hypothetical protein HUU06_14255 [Planctomycetaceae bacterium]|nr:hypothetical protein [Planctomycetota bacterium]NUN53930.1 hypothetical protein [Planctomycetaceae bacterium]
MARLPALPLLPLLLLASAAALAGEGGGAGLLERFDRPPAVSANFQEMPAGKAVAELCRQAGCPAIGVDGKGKRITLELKEVPFWEAVDRVAAAGGLALSGLRFEKKGGPGGEFLVMDPLRLSPPGKDLLPSTPCSAGTVRVSLVAVVLERSSKAVSRFSAEAEAAEPGKEVLRVGLRFVPLAGLDLAEAGSLRVDAAVDEKGRAFRTSGDGMSSFGSDAGIAGDRWAVFDASGGTGERLAEFAGALEVLLPAAEETAELDLTTLPATARIGGTTFTVLEVGDASMKVTVAGALLGGSDASPPGPQVVTGEEGGGGMFGPKPDALRVLLRDAAGKVLTSSSWGGGGGDVMTYDFDLSGRPVKATVSARTKVEKRDVPFRFKDVPLPR